MKTNLIKNSGPEIGSELNCSKFQNYDFKVIDLKKKNKSSALFFLSLTCNTCLKLMPQINDIRKEYDEYLYYIFTDGQLEDNREISDYFEWYFPVIKQSSNEMLHNFNITYNPFVILVNSNGIVESKGVIYESSDFTKIIQGG